MQGTDATSGVDHVSYQLDSGTIQTTTPGTSTASIAITGDRTHTLKTMIFDAAGNDSGWNTQTIKVDTTAPAAPTVTAPADGSTTNTEPTITLTAAAGSTVTVYIDGSLAGTTTADESGNATFTPTSPLDDGPHSVYVTATDQAGNTSQDSTTTTFTVKTSVAAPTVTTPANGSLTHETTPRIDVSGEMGASATIELDGQSYGPVALDQQGHGELQLPGALSAGQHVVRARQTDTAGNVSAWSAPNIWTVKTQTSVSLTGPTAGPTATADPTVSYEGEHADEFEILLDGQLVATGVIPDSGAGALTLPNALADGPHMITITVTDQAGNTASDSVVITVDTSVALQVSITQAPAQSTSQTSATFAFDDGSTVDRYQCSIDGSAWGACTSPLVLSGLATGPHTLLVRSVSPAGKQSAGVEYSWSVDTTPPPAPPILSGPGSTLVAAGSHFTFSPAPGDSLQYALDGGPWTPCPASITLNTLTVGKHSLMVRQLDAAGVASPPTVYSWVVVHHLPKQKGEARRAKLTVARQSTAYGGRIVDIGCTIDRGTIHRCTIIARWRRKVIGRGRAHTTRGRTVVVQ